MKRIITFGIALIISITVCGCGSKTMESRFADGSHEINADNFPKICTTDEGYALAEKIAETVLGKGLSEDKKSEIIIHCDSSNAAYTALAERRCDMVIAMSPTVSVSQFLTEQSVTLNSISIKKDAFVFYCNSDNPLTDLTSEQLKTVFAGVITKWSQLGGDNYALTVVLPREGCYENDFLSEKFEISAKVPKPRRNIATSDGTLTCNPNVYDNGRDVLGMGMFSSINAPDALAKGSIRAFKIDGAAPLDEGYPFNCELLLSIRGELSADNPVKLVFDWLNGGQGSDIIGCFNAE